MADKPTSLPEWATDGSAVVTEPNNGKKVIGWVGAEKPPAQFFNWLLRTIFFWVNWLDDSPKFQKPATPTDDSSPTMAAANRDGSVHWFVDDNGIPGGLFLQQLWVPQYVDSVATAGQTDVIVNGSNDALRATTGTDCTVDAIDPSNVSANWPANVWLLNAGQNLDQKVSLHTWDSPSVENYYAEISADGILMLEWAAAFSAIGATTDHNTYMGFHGNPADVAGSADYADANTHRFVMFSKEDADTNWFAHVGDNVATAETKTDTGVAPTANTIQIFRIEIHGSATPRGVANSSNTVAVFYIDGTEVATLVDGTDNVPNLGGMGVGFRMDSDGITPTVDLNMEVGFIRYTVVPYHDFLGSSAGYTLSA